jgi:dolichol-phosphate mannosyltransferase
LIKIIICAYNEEQNLQKLLTDLTQQLELLQREFEIIFCLDGTNDNSKTIISIFSQKYKITILPESNKRGLGIAYKKIFKYLLENSLEEDLIISLDADNTHNPKQISSMIEYFEENKLELLIASRFFEKSYISSFPIYRQLISKSTSLILKNLFNIKNINQQDVMDYTSGYRIYSHKILKKLYEKYQDNFICEPEFTYTCEILIKISKLTNQIGEIAIHYDYHKKIGKSKMRIVQNLIRLIAMIINLKISN